MIASTALLVLALAQLDPARPYAATPEELLGAAHPGQLDLAARTYRGRILERVDQVNLAGDRTVLLVATTDREAEPDRPPSHEWALEVVKWRGAHAHVLRSISIGRSPLPGGVAAQLENASSGSLRAFRVMWGVNNESDGGFTWDELWRLRGDSPMRLFRAGGFSPGSPAFGGMKESRLGLDRSVPDVLLLTVSSSYSYGEENEPSWGVETHGSYRVTAAGVTATRAFLDVASATSELAPAKEGDYRAVRAIDGRPETAWCEGAPGPGVGQSLTVVLNEPLSVAGVTVLPGFGKSPALFQANARPRRIRLELGAGRSIEHELRDALEAQRIPIPPGPRAQEVKLTVLSVYPGTRYPDLCISELSVDGAL